MWVANPSCFPYNLNMSLGRILLAMILSIFAVHGVFAGAKFARTEEFQLYVTVGDGIGEDAGPLAGAMVALRGPEGAGGLATLVPTTKTSDEEGAVRFTFPRAGKYLVSVSKVGYEDNVMLVTVKDSTTYVDIRMIRSNVRIRVRVRDADSGVSVADAKITTKRQDQNVADHMTSDDAGEATVVIKRNRDWTGGDNFAVTVSHPSYETQTGYVKSAGDEGRDLEAPFALKRKGNWKLATITVLEAGTRAPIMGAKVMLNGGGNRFYTDTTGADGTAAFRVETGVVYDLSITTDSHEKISEKLDLKAARDAAATYVLDPKGGGREFRRALIVSVKGKGQDGVASPLRGAVVTGPGLHDPVTDENGRIIFLHTVPPGETITLTASAALHKSGSTTVLVRDKGLMVDLGKLARDSKGGSLYDAFLKQNAQAYDTAAITLDWGEEKTKRVTGVIESPSEAEIGSTVSYRVKLTLEQGDETGFAVEEVIQVLGPDGALMKRDGNIRALNEGEESSQRYNFSAAKPGTYRIKVSVLWKQAVLWSGEKTVKVIKDRSESEVKPRIEGDVVPNKGTAKTGETVSVEVALLFSLGSADTLDVTENVELYGPGNKIVTNNLGARTLKFNVYSRRRFDIVCHEVGTYTVKATAKGADGLTWSDSASFAVTRSATAAKGAGYYRLEKTDVGKVSTNGAGNDGNWSGSISATSFTASYQSNPPQNCTANFTLAWSTPPNSIRAGDTVELTSQGSATVSGPDWKFWGAFPEWGAEGSATLVAVQKVFVGRGSDGRFHPSGTGKFRLTVGSGGKIRLWAQHGLYWGSDGIFAPAVYHYVFVPNQDPPPDSGKIPTIKVGQTLENLASPFLGNFAGELAIPLIGSKLAEAHKITFNIRPSTDKNQLTLTGRIERVNSSMMGYTISLSGNVSSSTGKIRANGALTLASLGSAKGDEAMRKALLDDPIFITLDGTFSPPHKRYDVVITIKSASGKVNLVSKGQSERR